MHKHLKMRRMILIFLGLAMSTGLWLLHRLNLKLNYTASYPRGLYQVLPFSPQHPQESAQKGELVLLCPPQNPATEIAKARLYLHFSYQCPNGLTPMIKRIVAIAGDDVVIGDAGVWVNGQLLVNSIPLARDSLQRPMPQAKSGKTAKDHIWVLSEYSPLSFDSRYFGAVNRQHLLGRIKPIWTEDD